MHTLSEHHLISQICRVCQQSKNLDYYSKDKRAKIGRNSICKQCDNQKAKKYYESNDEARKEYRRNYREQNLEKVTQAMRHWQINNPEKISQYTKNRLQRRIENGLFYVSKKELKKIYESECFYCGANSEIQTDHIIPISKGGRHSIGNLVAACRRCNQSKGKKLLVEWKYKK